MKRLSVMVFFGAWALAPLPGYADEALGRLFYTPEQRARMDVARQHERSIRLDEEESAPPSANILLNGVITRSDGKSTVWINNRLQNAATQSAIVRKGGEVRVVTPGAKRTVPLKVGQSIDMTSGEVEEVYRRAPALLSKDQPPDAASPSAAKQVNAAEKRPSRAEPGVTEPADGQPAAMPDQ
ncbi:MAG: hypothetical protein Q7V00_04325 [Sulfurimicrobium sp.]|nr:hypothetical protein [Sulfurimicrobium sp.]MDO9188417.1 hypothetical protein [Sulfurimicrobium sp.]MDP1704430.1 hypothetical protein [Sulfurimicrobium sp.]MDP2197068.1 hypothetical protein [Sulfurimicrobium sp.]